MADKLCGSRVCSCRHLCSRLFAVGEPRKDDRRVAKHGADERAVGPEFDNFDAVKSSWEKSTGYAVDWQGTHDLLDALDALDANEWASIRFSVH